MPNLKRLPDDANPAEGVPVEPMSTAELVKVAIASVPARLTVGLADVYGAFLADSKCENTRLHRVDAIEAFRRFLNAPSPEVALVCFLEGGRGTANALGLAFRNHEVARGLVPATINLRHAALRRAVKLARRFDVIDWEIELEDLPNTHQADRRGPGVEGFKALWAAALARGDNPNGLQTQALLRVLYDGALRKNEAVTLDLEHVRLDRQPPALHLLGKGKQGRQFATINFPTVVALRRWIEARGDEPGPLFIVQPTRPARCRPLAPRVAQWRAEGASDVMIAGWLNQQGAALPSGCSKWTASDVYVIFPRVASCYAGLVPLVKELAEQGATNPQIAARLNSDGHRMSNGRAWTAHAVCNRFVTNRMRTPEKFRDVVMLHTGLDRIHDKWVNRFIHKLAREAGLPFVVRPHGLRHASITRALDLTNGDIRKVQRFGRHASPVTTMKYDDDRKDLAGEVSRMLGDDLGDE
jgi:site-specific recombinase XerC